VASVKQTLWQAIRQQRELEAFVVPRDQRSQEKLGVKVPEDRILVLRYLYETRANGGIDRDQWRRLNPELWERLLEICPKGPPARLRGGV
jgi:hypothetical protein